MAGLDPAIHLLRLMDTRVKPAYDGAAHSFGIQFALVRLDPVIDGAWLPNHATCMMVRSRSRGAAAKEGRKHEDAFCKHSDRRHIGGVQRGGSRRRMRPWLASWPLWRLPTQSAGRRGPGRRGAGSGRRGAARPRLPLRHRVAVRTLPRLLIFFKARQKAPLARGFFYSLLKRSARQAIPAATYQ